MMAQRFRRGPARKAIRDFEICEVLKNEIIFCVWSEFTIEEGTSEIITNNNNNSDAKC